MDAWIRFCNALGRWVLIALIAIGVVGLIDRIAGDTSPLASAIGVIVVVGWALCLIGVVLSLAYAVTTLMRPMTFWRSTYPWILGLAMILIESMWWTAERGSAIAITIVGSLVLALLIVRLRGHLLAGSHLFLGSVPLALSAVVGRDLGFFNPLLAAAALLMGVAGMLWWFQRAEQPLSSPNATS